MKTVYIIPTTEVMVCESVSALCASGDEPVEQTLQQQAGQNPYAF